MNSWFTIDDQPEIDYPQWQEAGRVHDWRNHIAEEVRDIWDDFTPEQRLVLANAAYELASNEEWD